MTLYQQKDNYLYLLKDIKFLTLCLFIFFLGYEYWEKAYLYGSFTITKTLGLVYFFLSIIDFKNSFSINRSNKRKLLYLFLLSWVFILSNLRAHIFYSSDLNIFTILFDLQFFILFWIVGNEIRNSPNKRNLLFIFFLTGVLSMYLLMINGIGIQSSGSDEQLDSVEEATRLWFMGMNPNRLGGLTVLASILLFHLSLSSKISGWKKGILLLLFIPLIHMLFLSGSLGSLLSLIISLSILIFLDKKIILSSNIFLISIFVVIAYFFMVDNINSNYLFNKLENFLTTRNTSGRTDIWTYHYQAVSDSFILGLGFNSGLRTSHNIFMDVFVWTGLMGLIIYIIFILSIFKTSIESILNHNSTLELAVFSTLLLLLMKSGGAFQIKYIWLFLAIISVPSIKDYHTKKT